MRFRNVLVAACLTAAAFVSPMIERLAAQSGTGIVISEFRFRGTNGSNDEFVELFNGGLAPVDVSGWLIRVSNNPNNNVSPTVVTRVIIPPGTVIDRGCHYLVINNNSAGGYSGAVPGDRTYTNGFLDDGGVAVTRDDLSIVDQVGHGLNGAFGEGTRLPVLLTDVNRGIQRRPSGTAGYIDTDDNVADFQEILPGDPQNSSSPCLVPPPVIHLPHDIQGPGATSPFPTGTVVNVRGVVTARKPDGFFLQTEAGMEDADPNTSEGLFVFVSGGTPDEAQLGRLVQVHGSVAEFVPANDPASAPRTELNLVMSVMDLGASTMPVPYTLTGTAVSDAGALDQLERFEGMRVMVPSLTSITGTGGEKNEADATATSDGTFYAVITGQARPFRGAGVARGYPVLPCEAGPCHIPIFDGNPERLRVDSDALEGTAAVDVSSGAVMTDIVGPLDFDFRTYTLLPEVTLTPVGGRAMAPAPSAGPDQFTIASFNMERFFDATDDSGIGLVLTPEAYETRLSKASLSIRTVLNNPDILGVQEVENLAVLQQLAMRVNADALAAGGAAPGYAAVLFEGTDPDGLDVGVLVKTAGDRVSVTSAEQIGVASTFVDPSDDSRYLLNERPPVVLRAVIQGPATSLPQPVTVIVNHLQSLADVGSDDARGARVRAQRRAQAEFLAAYIQDRQLNDHSEAIVSIGDYNAFGFNDGYVDTVGTILGTPAAADQAATPSPDLVSPDLVNLADFMAESERYSSLVNGNAQALEHALVTANLVSQFADLVYPRVNADFPKSLRGDAATPQRVSDRDPIVAYFTFAPDLEAPVFSFAPPNQQVEATSAAGASVTYAAPAATDNLDGDVNVACEPASGATHPLGNTGVTCTAADAAGNVASVSFTVTVEDTTAPHLTVPAGLTVAASSAAGHVVNYTATATDAVTAAPAVTCAPASGTMFKTGVTTVQCSTADAAGNSAGASFSVTITAPKPGQPGRMHGAGTIGSGRAGTVFALDVRESANHVDRGWLVAKVASGYFAGSVSHASFANSPGFSPGKRPRSGNDSVTFAGSGWWNGHPGYAFEAAATDQGEPGRRHDTFTLVVRRRDGSVVATGAGTLSSGNIQSLR